MKKKETGCGLQRIPSEDEVREDRQCVLHSLPLSVCLRIKISSVLIFSPKSAAIASLTGSNQTTGPFSLAGRELGDLGA